MNKELLYRLENEIYIKHAISEQVFEEVLRFVQYGRHDDCLCVIGPTGVGKSKMKQRLVSHIVKRLDHGWNLGRCQPLTIEAPSQNKKEFPWRGFMEEMLIGLGEKGSLVKVDLNKALENRKNGLQPPSRNKLTLGQLERLIRLRVNVLKPVVVIIDEAQNLVEGLTDSARKENVNMLKNWANTMDTKFILFGTHETKDILNLNEQLTRRVSPIYFPRYAKNRDGIYLFASFYKGLMSELDIKIDPKIQKDFLSIYNYTLGCPGLLVTWIYHCIAYCIDKGMKKITYDVWLKNRISNARLTTIEKAIKTFELFYEDIDRDFNPDDIGPDERQLDIHFAEIREASKQKRTGNQRPGIQKPRRHPVHEN